MKDRALSILIYGLTSAIGVLAFLYPFWMPALPQSALQTQAHATDAPLMLSVLVGVCFVVLLAEVQGESVSAKFVALLGILVAINAVLRFAEVAIPGPGGFSPIFFLIILTGYIFGGRFGFLMGALTLLVSALITGTVGPWLPYQMFTAGWVGMTAPLARPLVQLFRAEGSWLETAVLAVFGGWWGLVYGAIMNVWFWPFAMGPASQYWQPGITVWDAVQRYALFYVTTSLVWDAMRAAGNILLMVALGAPTLRALRRFRRRFTFVQMEILPEGAPSLPVK